MIAATPPVPYVASAVDGHYFETLRAGPTNWVQSTITVPSTISWSAPDQFASAWTMMHDGPNVYTQVGWLSDTTFAPRLFTESSVNGRLIDSYYPQYPLSAGRAYTFATSCDLGTGTYHDFIKWGGRYKLLATVRLPLTCGAGLADIDSELFSLTAPIPLPLEESGSFYVSTGVTVALP